MGTCPKCKRKIRKNGNHVKLGSTWYHKVCPGRSASARRAEPGTLPSLLEPSTEP